MDEDVTRVEHALGGLAELYAGRGFSGRLGFGNKPAVLVVDVIHGFTRPDSPFAVDMNGPIAAIRRVLDRCREAGVPVFFSAVSYGDMSEAGIWAEKIPVSEMLRHGTAWVEVDARLGRRQDEALMTKKYASFFFGTDLASRLVSRQIDTVIVTGCSTSGCVRATVVDACSYGFRTLVVSDGVGDRHPLSHEVSLVEMDTRYADVVDSETVCAELGARDTRRS